MNPFNWTLGQALERLVFLLALVVIALDLFVWRP